MGIKTSVDPGSKWFKKITAKVVLVILGRAFQVLSRKDLSIAREIDQWPEGFKMELNIMPYGPNLIIEKNEGFIYAKNISDKAPDLSVNFKNVESAFMLLTPLMGVPQGFAEHRFVVIGDVAKAMSFTRCLNLILAYLYPDFLCRNLMRNIPEINFLNRMSRRAYFYSLGLILGF